MLTNRRTILGAMRKGIKKPSVKMAGNGSSGLCGEGELSFINNHQKMRSNLRFFLHSTPKTDLQNLYGAPEM